MIIILAGRKLYSQDLSNTFKLFISFFFPKLGDYVGGNFLGEQESFFRKIFWESMNEREKSGMQRGDAIDFLLQLKNEEQSKKFRESLVTLSSSARDIPSIVIIISFLAYHCPRLQTKYKHCGYC